MDKIKTDTKTLQLSPEDNQRLAALCGQTDEHITLLENHYNIKINNRGFRFSLSGDHHIITQVTKIIEQIYAQTKHNAFLERKDILKHLTTKKDPSSQQLIIQASKLQITTRNQNQYDYINRIQQFDINFGIGPAGTGKTFLAVASAVAALNHDQVQRIILVRPAVEAGESLGFLPGDLSEKIHPYLQPLYDALDSMLGSQTTLRLIEKNVIEVAPLAYMRGRTLNDAFIILDEAQNCTRRQMKMFLTRLGFNAKAVITGDITQIDLADPKRSGLTQAKAILSDIKQIGFTYFDEGDVVRHPLVKQVLQAYRLEHGDRS